ncbi:oxygenase MpaB family protein [Nocardiopsis potens]|uniref:oxygenase MpaB family protein n=1 Tax=Nocardiopsis potens TaxID=1246458 RepID=UPI00034AD7DA|nr:oxygenase MpaB family protein [Nocardiopsis potens]
MEAGTDDDRSELRRISGEAAVLGGAAYAILMQVSHPGVGQGVADHSDFAQRPVDRLRATLTFVYTMAAGTPEEVDRVSRTVRAAHARVRGPGYDARDPDLQTWVAATLYEGGLRLYETALGPLPPDRGEAAYRQAAVYATALGCPADHWPPTRGDFERYWSESVAALRPGETARGIARDLFHPRNPLLGPPMRLQRFLAAGLLPAHVRDGLGLPWGPRSQRRFDRFTAALRAVYPRLPLRVRTAPMALCLWDMRRRAARGGRPHRGSPPRRHRPAG